MSGLRAPTFGQSLGAFLSLAETTARSKLTYRLSALVSLAASGLGYAVFFVVWLGVYRDAPDAPRLPKSELLSYLVLAFVLNFVLTLTVELRFGQRLRGGLIASDLLRPLGFLPFQMGQALGDVLANAGFALPILAVGALFAGQALLPGSAAHALLALPSVALAFLIHFALSYAIVQVAFVSYSLYGAMFTRIALHQAFSGVAAPLVLFPPALLSVANVLPFRHVIETPVVIWLGRVPLERVPALLSAQLGWAAGLLAVGAASFRVVLARHQIQGG